MKFSRLGLLEIIILLLGLGIRVCADANVYISTLEVPERVINKLPDLKQEVPIKVTVSNTGDSSGAIVYNLTVNGNVTATRRVVVGPGESQLDKLFVDLFGEPIKATWPGNKNMVGAAYLFAVNGLSATTSVTPFPDFTIYVIVLDIVCFIITALFIRWVTSSS
jgi:hypothetical protein